MQHVINEMFHLRRFGSLPEKVSELVSPQFYPKGSIIIRQGEPACHFFYIHSGRVRTSAIRPDGTEKVLAYAEPGQFFADGPFFRQSSHYYTGEVLEPTYATAFTRETLDEITRVSPDFIFTLMQSMAHKVWMLSNQMMTITFEPTEVRLARSLIEILTRKPEGTVSLAITHQEISTLVGTSRVMVTRVLNGWRTRGIVELRKAIISVKDFPALERIADFANG